MGKENVSSVGTIRLLGAFTTIDSSGQSALIRVFCGQRVCNRTRNYPQITQMDADVGKEKSDLSYSTSPHFFSALISVFCGQSVCNRTRNYPQITQNDADVGKEKSDLSYSTSLHSLSALICVFCGQSVCNRTRNYPQITRNDADMGRENVLSAGKIRSFGAFTTIDSSGQSALICVFCGQSVFPISAFVFDAFQRFSF
jgi:hypothetical protein